MMLTLGVQCGPSGHQLEQNTEVLNLCCSFTGKREVGKNWGVLLDSFW